ncbi:S8 family serine peptidase [Lujinxingia litoralis]|nr:S8 family serine peptidase [Lujinxingia litoralis]
MMRYSRPHHRRLAPAAAALTGLTLIFGMGGVAAAQSAPEISPAAPWQACLNGQAPSTQNVPGVDISGLHEIPADVDILDTNPDYDEVVLDFDDRLDNAEIQAFARQQGLHAELNSPFADDANIFVARVEEGAVPFVKDCLTQSAPQGWLESVEENIEYRAFFVPDDPLYQFQWNFEQVGAEEAWKVSTGRDVVVAVIDTGVTVEDNASGSIKVGKDLKGIKTVPGYDFVDKTDFVYDGHGHGTHVAGTIAQATNNGYGVAGLAFESKIMPLRVLNSRGFGSVADIADAVRFAADNGAQVINMSLGGPLPSLVLKRAVDYAHKKGVTVVAAAGNAGKRSPSYPAAYAHSFAVAATQFDQRTTFYSQWGTYVDIAAPGGNTRIDQNGDGRPDGIMQETHPAGKTAKHEFALYMGTSMASPHVAAAAAMVIATGVTHPDKVQKVLQNAADTSMREKYDSEVEYRERYGAGLLQVDKAVRNSTTGQGTTRYAGALLLVLMSALGLRRRDIMGRLPEHLPLVATSAAVVAGGLFFIPLLVPAGGMLGFAANVIGRPLAEANVLVSGLGAHQNPLFASFLIPLVAYAFLGGHRVGRAVAGGIALGMAGFSLTEAFLLTSDVSWIPGMNLLDRIWLAVNGLLSLAIGFFGLKRD